ncbi:YgaP family membrane protein [Dethiothermospora halolimnae]|uniref:YgaP family membrane protein n=1 Tax=Dethiothermospora halolimnae TaxID=3114390 RepID=UPI003CCB86C1
MKKNVGDLDAYLRITGGLTMFGVGVAKDSSSLIALGAMKVAEGITRFCPALYMLGISTNNDDNMPLKFSKNFDTDES